MRGDRFRAVPKQQLDEATPEIAHLSSVGDMAAAGSPSPGVSPGAHIVDALKRTGVYAGLRRKGGAV